ncbi:glycosyltransferase family 2 protein [Quadrisphaera oryzae]|uniref:glycosyltransferase family 2 protein n=1 Tax=Quadrisphaera TaxID=317661 RepID=UPI0016443A5C|nr:glycosyltransferase family 2 protein [Quadrisphaera sp. RL12-1S]
MKATYEPVVTIVAPIFNAKPYLAGFLELIRSLEYRNTEIIIVDDASTDGSADFLEENLVDGEAQLIRCPTNIGPGPARNEALRVAHGDFIWFVDCDDSWEPTILSRLLEAASDSGADVICCGFETRGIGGRRLPLRELSSHSTVHRPRTQLLIIERQLSGYLWNKLFKASALRNLEFPARRTLEDFQLVAEVSLRCSTVTFIPDVLYCHQLRESSISQSQLMAPTNLAEVADHLIILFRKESAISANHIRLFTLWFHVLGAVRLCNRTGGARVKYDTLRLLDFRALLLLIRFPGLGIQLCLEFLPVRGLLKLLVVGRQLALHRRGTP